MLRKEMRRFFRSSPLLSFSGIVVLGIGIGASALTLALLFALSSLTYPGMRTLGYATIAEETEGGGSIQLAWRRFEQLRASPTQSASLAAYSGPVGTTLMVGGRSRPVKVAVISSGFFSRFTPRLLAGRDFTAVEEGQAGRHVVILSAALAAELFQSAQNALEQSVIFRGLPYRVVGVAPRSFNGIFGDAVEAWVPANCVVPLVMDLPSGPFNQPDSWKGFNSFYGVAASDRLQSAELVAYLAHSLPLRTATESALHVSPGLTTDPVRDAKLRKWLRLGLLLALVFTIVSSLNYVLLLLARTPRYVEEVRLKRALGAVSVRLMAELMIGPATMMGAGLFVAALIWAGGLISLSRLSGSYGQLVQGGWHAAWLAFGVQMLLACGLTLIVALLPALALLRDNGVPSMGHTHTVTRRSGRLLQLPVVLQIAFCAGMWILAGMIVSSLLSVMRTPLGYDPSHLTVIRIGPTDSEMFGSTGPHSSFPTSASIANLLQRLDAVPGVRSAGYGNAPFEGETSPAIRIERLDRASATPSTVYETRATPSYFRTLGARILRGTGLSPHGGVHEIVINQTLAKELWSKDNPMNRPVRLIYPGFAGVPSYTHVVTIVGVVEDMRISGFTETPAPTITLPIAGGGFIDLDPRIIVNGTASSHSLEAAAGPIVTAQMPGLKVLSTYSVAEQARASLLPEKQRAYSVLAGALIMAVLAYIGLFATLAYYVGTRRRELAVRICFGASPWAVRKIILTQAAQCAVAAVMLSLPLWLVLARLSSNDYLGRVSWSTGRAVLISLVCIMVSLLISLVPATTAARVSPSAVLKEQ